jgi:TonB family protein
MPLHDITFTPLDTMRYGIQAIASLCLVTVLCQPVLADPSTEGSSSSWPVKVIALEQLESLTPYQLKVRRMVTKGKVTGPAVVRAHVDLTGAVLRAVLHTSCGNADLDEAAILGMKEMRFKPFLDGGSPIPVTLLAPIHVPARLGRSN